MRKRLLSLLLVLALVWALMPMPAQAAGGALIRCENITAAPGHFVCVPINCENFENLASLELDIYYDPEVLHYEFDSQGWMLNDTIYTVHSTEGRISFSAISARGISGSGEFIYLYFSVASDCPAGKYPLTLAVGEAYDTNLTPMTVSARNGSIQVADSAPAYGEFHLNLNQSAKDLANGDILTVTVQNSWYHGFAGMDLKVLYDATVFELVSAKASSDLGNALCSVYTGTDGLVRLCCASTWQTWCYDLLELELRVRDGVSGDTWITAEVSDVYDENRIPYQPSSVNAHFTVTPALESPTCGLRLESETMVIGQESLSTLILDADSGLAAADFHLEYDASLVECLAVESAADDGYLVINPNFTNGLIRFSYVKESGTTAETPLVTIRWKPRTGAAKHFTLKTTLIDPVDKDHAPVEISCPVYSGCIYLTQTSVATCTQPGGTARICLGCGDRIPLDTVPALGHSYGEPEFQWTEDHERCTAVRICTHDASHVWQVDCTVTHVSTGESCTAPGTITYTATADFYGEIYTDQVTVHLDSLGHDYNWTVITEPGCTTEGLRRGQCIRCTATTQEVITPLGHRHDAIVTDPTCTEAGFTTHTCFRCGDSYQDSHRDPLGHDWSGNICLRCGEKLTNPFVDVPEDSFYYAPVIWAVELGITNGTSATTFGPSDSCMRAHVVTFLWRAAGSPEPASHHNPFVDVTETDFYYKAVLWAVENGITNGLDASHFGPFAYCNRAQVVTFLHRALNSPYPATDHNPFSDVPAGSFYHIPVLWAVEKGITNGLSATEFGPNSICNRAQIVTFLYRAFA